MGNALLWIVGILVVGYIAWNWLVIPWMINVGSRVGAEFQRNPKLVTDLKQFNTDLKHPPPHPAAVQHHHPANYGYYYY
jgi:hypothetical protein